jgi:amino acid adenylation domain-containing protein
MVKGINARIAALSPEQRALLEKRLQQQKSQNNLRNNLKIAQRKATDTLCLSVTQEKFWLLQQLQPDLTAYNELNLLSLQGQLDITILKKSLNKIIKRHEILRTSFQSINEEVVQIIAPELKINLPVINLQGLSKPEQDAKVKQIILEYSNQPFNLAELPLFKIVIIQLQAEEYILFLNIHHIIFDGWSSGIFYQELAALYQAFSNGEPSPLPELPIQYADFALWQKKSLQDKSHLLNYWKQQLKDAPPILNLPTDYPRPAQQSFRGARATLIIPQNLTDELKYLSQQEGVTLFIVLLAAFKTLLYRYTGQTDLLIGTPVANRTHSQIENLLGCFVNTLVLRTEVSGELSFKELVKRLRETALAAYAHQELPFEQLVKELQPERASSHTPLFQVMFVLQDAPMLALQLPNLNLAPLMIDNGTAKFDLTLYVEDTKQGLKGFLEYNTDLFHADTINRMLGHLETLLEGIVANPQQSLGELPLLNAAQRYQLLEEWNNTEVEYSQDQCIHQLFEAQVEKTPDAVAVVFENQQLTYQELNTKANQLAHYLQKLGVKPEVLVGICVERSLEMIIALLAILKAGGAYVPLDPNFPIERLAFMVEDSQISLLLTQHNLYKNFPLTSAQIICLDRDWENTTTYPQNPFNSSVNSSNLSYTIYTSGSTGKPKGVQITHTSVVNFLIAMQHKLQLTNTDNLLSVTTLSFDIAVLEIFLPLTTGAKLILVSREVATDSTQLLQQLNNSTVTLMQATPATWRMLLDAGWEGNSQLTILCGGEALPQNLALQLCQRAASVWNLYGPTETTIWSTIHQVDKSEAFVPIGRPIANTQIYILDKHLKPVPIGVIGELHIGGVGLARGYWNKPELTQEKFICSPFETGKYLYKTGDLARYLPNGDIEYLGRIDYQVKIRGFRIELGEIEAAIHQHPEIREVVVIVREDKQDDKRLVAYVVPQSTDISVFELRNFLKVKLPDYMIPSAFVMLEEIPLTPNGKIDRRALPAPDIIQHSEENTSLTLTPVQEMLAGIWADILGIKQVGINDNFFELGGHSLLATQVISRIRKTFGVDIPLQHLFESPTIAELAEEIQQTNQQGVSAITPVSRDENLPLSFAQARLWLLEQLNPDSDIYNMPAAVRLVGELNVEALEESINEIIRRHEVLRTIFTLVNGEPLQVIVPDVQLKIPVVDLRELPKAEQEAKIEHLSIKEFQLPFDFTQAPLLRCKLLQLEKQEYVLLFTIHHIVFDGWSQAILIKEIAALYSAVVSGKPASLPALPIQYADFAVWQRQHLQGERRETLLTYWKQQLANLPVLQLPTTSPRAEVKTNRGASHSFVIPDTVSQQLKQLSQQENVTLFMTLLASFKILLQRYSNQDDIVVGTDVANRNQAEIEPLIGFFINLLVLRTDLSGNPTFLELLQRVCTQTLAAYAHQDLPFDELVRELQPERHLSNTVPLFQVLFVLQNTPNSALELPGLTLNLLEVESKTARFDLALFLTETEQGIEGKWQYNADLFTSDTITKLTHHWQTLINSIVAQPQSRINTLEMLTEPEKVQQTMQQQQRKAAKRQKFMSIAPKAVNLSVEQLIKTYYLQDGQKFPLVIQPNSAEIEIISWTKNNREYLKTELFKHGAILFRGFDIKAVADFENFAQTICPNLFAEYGDLPRTGEGGKVYGSTPYPADKAILFHNESSHLHCFPLKIWFYCVQPAEKGGETPIVDCRKAYKLLSLQLREKLASKQLMYTRNYAEGLDVSWQNFFQTTDKKEVENYCRQAKIDFEWYDDNGLITRQIRPALAVHPNTSEPVFFNQIQLHHISYLDTDVRESLLSIFGESKLPRNVYFGDGSPITSEEIAEINAVYQQAQTSFSWQKGDIIMLDNMLAAHGRKPFVGQRKIVVAMAEMTNGTDTVNVM